jgi:hypothetical protein
MCNPNRRLALCGSFLAIAGGAAAALTASNARDRPETAVVQPAAADQTPDLDRRLGDIDRRLDAQQQAIDQLAKTGAGKRAAPRD